MQDKLAALKMLLDNLKGIDAEEMQMLVKRRPMSMPETEDMGSENEKEDDSEGIEISPEALAILQKLKR